MELNELANKIIKEDNNRLSKAFTMCIGELLIDNGIQPIIHRNEKEYIGTDLNQYIISKEYNVSFNLDTKQHDIKIFKDTLENLKDYLINKGYYSNILEKIIDEFVEYQIKGRYKEYENCCKNCSYHYELTEEQKQNYDGHCGCTSLESTGRCYKADIEEY